MHLWRMRPSPVALSVAVLLVLAQACTSSEASPEADVQPTVTVSTATPTPGLVHQVYFWLQPGLDAAAREDFVAGMRSLAAAPTVRAVIVGTAAGTPAREVTDNSFDYFLTLHFDDVAGHDAYQVSETHLAFVAAHEAKFREVRVYDGAVVGE